ncbi:hypothetical protein ABIB25_005339 [Nakamurella sp. UYEF19]
MPEYRPTTGTPRTGPGFKSLVTAWWTEGVGGPNYCLGLDLNAAHDGLSIDPAAINAEATEIMARRVAVLLTHHVVHLAPKLMATVPVSSCGHARLQSLLPFAFVNCCGGALRRRR